MKDKKQLLKKHVSYVMAFALILTGSFFYSPAEVKAANPLYVAAIITDYNDFLTDGTEYVCTTTKFRLGDLINEIPAGSAIVTVKATGEAASTTHGHGAQISVHCPRAKHGTGFDYCEDGAMKYITNDQITRLGMMELLC